MAAFDFKKAYRDLYQPKDSPVQILVPPMGFIAVEGQGNPNAPDGAFQHALEILYGLCYTIKMSKMGDAIPDGYYDYVVPPLEGLWEMEGGKPGVDYGNKDGFVWTAMIRQPEFVTQHVYQQACASIQNKKGIDPTPAKLITYQEGLCVQCMHFGPFDNEPATVAKMEAFMVENGLESDFSPQRRHHEIYLSDFRKTAPEKLRTVLRIPVKALEK